MNTKASFIHVWKELHLYYARTKKEFRLRVDYFSSYISFIAMPRILALIFKLQIWLVYIKSFNLGLISPEDNKINITESGRIQFNFTLDIKSKVFRQVFRWFSPYFWVGSRQILVVAHQI